MPTIEKALSSAARIVIKAIIGAVVGGLSGGAANRVLGGSFKTGFIGGAIGGAISGAFGGSYPNISSFAGGFIGSFITDYLDAPQGIKVSMLIRAASNGGLQAGFGFAVEKLFGDTVTEALFLPARIIAKFIENVYNFGFTVALLALLGLIAPLQGCGLEE